jgi:hypothetical protein
MAKTAREKPRSGRTSSRQGGLWGWLKRTFSHRRLIAGEALLVVGVVDRLGRRWVTEEAPVPNWLKVVILMALVIGIFGGLILVLQKVMTTGLAKTHDVVKALPLPTPIIFVHAAAFVGLFFAYAWAAEIDVWKV